jgi:hypothetical protein
MADHMKESLSPKESFMRDKPGSLRAAERGCSCSQAVNSFGRGRYEKGRFEGYEVDADCRVSRSVDSDVGRGLAGQADLPAGSQGVKTRYRINDSEPFENIIPQLEYSNKFRVAVLPTRPALNEITADASIIQVLAFGLSGSSIIQRLTLTWRLMTEFQTSRGPILVKIPLYDDAVQEVIRTCNSRN